MKRRTSGTWAIAALAAVVVILFLAYRPAAVEAAYPAERAAHALSSEVGPRLAGFLGGVRAAAENVGLRRENARLQMVERENAQLRDENARLRQTLGAAARLGADWLPAGVLSRGGGAAGVRRTVRIGRGTRDGVAEGQCVAVPAGLVGLVTAVTPHTAEVTLLGDLSLRVSCEVGANGPRVRGIVVGDGSAIVVRHLTNPAAVRAGAAVATSGLGGVFPKGIPVGRIEAGAPGGGGEASATGEFALAPAVDGMQLEEVFVRRER